MSNAAPAKDGFRINNSRAFVFNLGGFIFFRKIIPCCLGEEFFGRPIRKITYKHDSEGNLYFVRIDFRDDSFIVYENMKLSPEEILPGKYKCVDELPIPDDLPGSITADTELPGLEFRIDV